ncbi:RNA-directed DNA polymerase from mobile element jockey [Trichonephila clavipes]|nr:RNA-directed DNA polymerase from mobile element jockey [Trichonephila clavipes]
MNGKEDGGQHEKEAQNWGGAGQQEEAKPTRTRRGRSQTRNWEKRSERQTYRTDAQKALAVHAMLKRLISRRSKLAIRHKVLLYKSIIRPVMCYGSQIFGSAGMCHLKKLHTLTNSFLRQIVNAPWFIRNEVIYRDLKIKPFLPHIKDLSKRFFDKLPSVPNELITNQPAYDPAVPSSQKRPRALLEHEFINFPQAKRLRVQI